MNKAPSAALVALFVSLAVTFLAGCDDERLAEMAERAADRQAEQNAEMSRLNREVAESHRSLIEAEANSRKDYVVLQHDLQSERSAVGQQRDRLECERREIAEERLRESILAPILANLGPILVCALVLVFCALLISGLNSDESGGDEVTEILIEEIISERPTALPSQASRKSIEARKPMSPVISDLSGADAEDD